MPGATATITPASEPPFTPKWQASLGVAYTFNLTPNYELIPRLDVSYKTEHFFEAGNVVSVSVDEPVTIMTGTVRLNDIKNEWSLTFGVDNLTDELYLEQGNASFATIGYAVGIYARPRNWFLSLSKDF